MNEQNENEVKTVEGEEVQQPSILFVDDEEAILSSIKSLLRKENYEQYYFLSPKKALHFLSQNHVDLIVTDLRMSEMGGEQFLRLAQSVSPRAIKIILSAYEEKSVVLESLAKGYAQFYLLKPWEDDEFKIILKKFVELHSEMQKQHIIKYLNSFSDLPNPSVLNQDVLEFFSEEVSINQLVQFIEKYPFIVTKLIQIANSVSFGAYRAITSVRDAIILMGIEPLKELLLSLGILDKFQNAMEKECLKLMNDIWDRSLKRGIFAKKVSLLWDKPFNKGIIFISSLVSDIGFFVWLYTEPSKYREFIKKLKTDEKSLQEIESEYFKYPHNELGATLLELWNFPFEVVNVVRNHHGNSFGNEVIKIVQMSEILEGSFPIIQHDESIDTLIPYFREKLDL